MSAAESNDPTAGEPFMESDDKPTKFIYDTGGLPIYIGMLWICMAIGFVTFILTYYVPDLASWFGK